MNWGNTIAEKLEREIKSRREKFLIFGNGIAAISSAHTSCLGGCSKCECTQGKPNDVGKKKFGNCGNAIAENGGKKNSGCQNHMWGIKKKKVLRLQYFYNIFTTNHMWLVIISSNLNLTLRLLF